MSKEIKTWKIKVTQKLWNITKRTPRIEPQNHWNENIDERINSRPDTSGVKKPGR